MHAFLPSSFNSWSFAQGIWNDGAITYVVGSAYNSTTSHYEAIIWRGILEPGFQTLHVPPHYDVLPPPTATQNKLVLVTHGWNTTADPGGVFQRYCIPLADSIRLHGGPNGAPLGADWNVIPYNWTADSGNTDLGRGQGPLWALKMARSHGTRVGTDIVLQHYGFVHLIGHSAGAGLLAEAAKQIKLYSPTTIVHTTYLDAFCGNMTGFGVPNGPDGFQEAFGGKSDWSEQYFSRESIIAGCTYIGSVDWTQQCLSKSYNVDITLADPAYGALGGLSNHCWPRCFYLDTVPCPVPFNCNVVLSNASCGLPTLNVGQYGYPLSYEATGGNVQTWLVSRQSTYHPGAMAIIGGGTPAPCQSYVTRNTPPIDPVSTPMFPGGFPGAVQVSPNTMTMNTQPPGAPAPGPTWANFLVTTNQTSNQVTFNMGFTCAQGAAGLMSLYIDGVQSGVVDEPYVAPGMNLYSMSSANDLPPGQHVIAFRLDPQNTQATTITVQNIATGMAEFVPSCAADFNRVNGLNVQDIFDFLNAWFALDPRADFNGVNSINAQDIFDFLAAWFAGC